MGMFTQDLVTTLVMGGICNNMDMEGMVVMEAMEVMVVMDPQRLAQ